VKAATIEKNLLSISQFLGRFSDRDLCRESAADASLAPCIKAVTHKLKRWENMPNCWEPFTPEMWHHLSTTLCPVTTSDSIEAACPNWFGMGLFGGFRLAKWAQPFAHRAIGDPHLSLRNDPQAFLLGDIKFRGKGSPLSHRLALAQGLSSVERVKLTFRTQKNGNHGKTHLFVHNKGNGLCFITCCFSAVQRFVSLIGWHYHIPVAVYRTADGVIQHIHAAAIERVMRLCAQIQSTIYTLSKTGLSSKPGLLIPSAWVPVYSFIRKALAAPNSSTFFVGSRKFSVTISGILPSFPKVTMPPLPMLWPCLVSYRVPFPSSPLFFCSFSFACICYPAIL
jgi:hypothetical protein